MPVNNKYLNSLLKKAISLQPPKKPLKKSLLKHILISIRLWFILFKNKRK